jgi:hypothetical protein
MINTSVAFGAYLPIRVSPQSAPLECFLKRKPSHGSQQQMASLRLAGALCKRLCGSQTAIASGKVTGADDGLGVLACEGFGLVHFSACAVRPFDTSGRTGWVFGGRWPFDTSGRTGGCISGTSTGSVRTGGVVWHGPFDARSAPCPELGEGSGRTRRGCSRQPQSFTGPSTAAPDAATALACCCRTRSTY